MKIVMSIVTLAFFSLIVVLSLLLVGCSTHRVSDKQPNTCVLGPIVSSPMENIARNMAEDEGRLVVLKTQNIGVIKTIVRKDNTETITGIVSGWGVWEYRYESRSPYRVRVVMCYLGRGDL